MSTFSVQDLVDQVRAQVDEFNEVSITDNQILNALNRAQQAAVRLTARRIDHIFLAETTLSTVAGQREYDMPEDILAKYLYQWQSCVYFNCFI